MRLDLASGASSPVPTSNRNSAAPFEIQYVRAGVVSVVPNERESLVALRPRFDMRRQMELGLLGHPVSLTERRD
ncbi:MAG: hypothetical protein JO039_14040 [Solirubrobacterales bacterium]|nr:hypothetical protein [Solirubrobacterales bacterium]